MSRDSLATVKLLFELAQIAMSDEEMEAFARTYPTARDQADALYREEFGPASPALAFDPMTAYA